MRDVDRYKVLDTLQLEEEAREKDGLEDTRVQYSDLVDRLVRDNKGFMPGSARPITSRHLKKLLEEHYVKREKEGRNVFYSVTPEGGRFLMTNRDLMDKRVFKWGEGPLEGAYASFAIVPGSLYKERDDSAVELHGTDKIQELVDEVKRNNPGIDSLYLRFSHEKKQTKGQKPKK